MHFIYGREQMITMYLIMLDFPYTHEGQMFCLLILHSGNYCVHLCVQCFYARKYKFLLRSKNMWSRHCSWICFCLTELKFPGFWRRFFSIDSYILRLNLVQLEYILVYDYFLIFFDAVTPSASLNISPSRYQAAMNQKTLDTHMKILRESSVDRHS